MHNKLWKCSFDKINLLAWDCFFYRKFEYEKVGLFVFEYVKKCEHGHTKTACGLSFSLLEWNVRQVLRFHDSDFICKQAHIERSWRRSIFGPVKRLPFGWKYINIRFLIHFLIYIYCIKNEKVYKIPMCKLLGKVYVNTVPSYFNSTNLKKFC